jgi:hypothetical protein
MPKTSINEQNRSKNEVKELILKKKKKKKEPQSVKLLTCLEFHLVQFRESERQS